MKFLLIFICVLMYIFIIDFLLLYNLFFHTILFNYALAILLNL